MTTNPGMRQRRYKESVRLSIAGALQRGAPASSPCRCAVRIWIQIVATRAYESQKTYVHPLLVWVYVFQAPSKSLPRLPAKLIEASCVSRMRVRKG